MAKEFSQYIPEASLPVQDASDESFGTFFLQRIGYDHFEASQQAADRSNTRDRSINGQVTDSEMEVFPAGIIIKYPTIVSRALNHLLKQEPKVAVSIIIYDAVNTPQEH